VSDMYDKEEMAGGYPEKVFCTRCHVFEAEPGESLCYGCKVEERVRSQRMAEENYEHNFNEKLRRHD